MAEDGYAARVSRGIKARMITQKVERPALAQVLGVNVGAVSRRLAKGFSLDDLEKIAPLFDTTPETLANPPAHN